MQTIDYLSLRLTDDFDFQQFLLYAQQPDVDQKTGKVSGVKIPADTFRLSATGGYHTVSLYRGSEAQGIILQKRYNLDVSRIDIAVDLEVVNPDEVYDSFEASVRLWRKAGDDRGIIMPDINYFESSPRKRNGAKGFKIGAASSDNQLRVYSKARIDGKLRGVRLEYQLRGDNARAVWAGIKSEPYNAKGIQYQFDACINRFHSGALPIVVSETAVLEVPEKVGKKGNTRDWLTGQVLGAIVRFFEETGEDMTEVLSKLFKEALVDKVERQALRDKSQQEYARKLAAIRRKTSRHFGTFDEEL